MMEQGLQPMSFEEFRREAMAGMAKAQPKEIEEIKEKKVISLAGGGISELLEAQMPIQDELKLFVEEFKRTNGRIPTQTEIFKGLKEKGIGRSVNTIKSYLTEGVDYSKPLTNLEAAKLGGPKIKGPEKVNKKLIKELKNLTVKGVYPYVANYGSVLSLIHI